MIFRSSPAIHDLLKGTSVATKLWLTLCLAVLTGVALIITAFNADQRAFTAEQLNTIGRIISQQTAASSASLLLADDRLSLTINLQQLVDLSQIDGAEIITPNGHTLAQVGHPSELTLEQPITAEATTLGTLRIHLNPLSDDYQLAQSLSLTLTFTLLGLLILITAVWLFNRRLSQTLTTLLGLATRPCRSSLDLDTSTLRATSPQSDLQRDELGQLTALLQQHFAEPAHPTTTLPIERASEQQDTLTSKPTKQANIDTVDTDRTVSDTHVPTNINSDLFNSPGPTQASEARIDDYQPEIATAPQPAPYNPSEPLPQTVDRFEHDIDPTYDQIEQPTSLLASNPQSLLPNHQGYLLYANHHVGGSDTLTSSERQQLLVRYRKSLEQVARLYKGELSEDALGNWCVRFSPLSNDHSHGINALCAAQLFNALYRGINTQAIRSFSPALNIKLVLLCGPLDNFDALAEDALLLSDKIQDNDLITHHALYQVQSLQERLLGSAKYRKHDDDTYLISALNNDYQTLIDRQAEHFLKQTY